MIIRGKVWKFSDDIDTDQIYPGKYLPLTDKTEMAKHAMEGTERGAEFLNGVQPGDLIVAGKNFGCGSSREHAAIAIRGAGVAVVIAESFARIFHRNCVNTSMPVLELKEISKISDGDTLEVDFDSGVIRNLSQDQHYQAVPLSRLEREIVDAGGLLTFLKKADVHGL